MNKSVFLLLVLHCRGWGFVHVQANPINQSRVHFITNEVAIRTGTVQYTKFELLFVLQSEYLR